MDPYATHQEVLRRACQLTKGPIVELGTGHSSTNLLHDEFPDRIIVSVEGDLKWMMTFARMANARHFFCYVKDYTNYELPVRRAGVLFVDCLPGEQRRLCVLKYANDADLIIAHDTEPTCWPGYAWGNCFDGFKYRWDDTRYERWTTVVSNVQPFSLTGP